jgi:hypothetical protein
MLKGGACTDVLLIEGMDSRDQGACPLQTLVGNDRQTPIFREMIPIGLKRFGRKDVGFT